MKGRNIQREWANAAYNMKEASDRAFSTSDELNAKGDYKGVCHYDEMGAFQLSKYRDICNSTYLRGLTDEDIKRIALGQECNLYDRDQLQIS